MTQAHPDSASVHTRAEGGASVYEAEIDGERIVWDDQLTYSQHLNIGPLLAAQIPVSDKPDEMLFIVMHQTMELWLKLLLHEAGVLTGDLNADDAGRASKTLERMETVIRHMTDSWEVLATLTPHDFLSFRHFLRRASGFQSHQFRQLEFALGLKRAKMTLVHQSEPAALAALEATLAAPSLWDTVLALLARRGFAIPPDKLARDWREPYEPSAAVEDAWLAIYRDPDAHRPLFALGERLAALDYHFGEWRWKHMKTVARVIGHSPGTGGSAGVDYLVRSLRHDFFPELWSMRTRLSAPGGAVGQIYGERA
jgi:tryptophan 2,3-dioxygenase